MQGDALTVLKTLPDESVHCIVTSPPYWRQRDYGVAGQLGLEPTPEAYIDRLVAIFRELRRVLRPDGTCWVNLGDKWASGGNGGGGSFMEERAEAWAHVKESKGWRKPPAGYKDKDLVGIPWMFAFAARDDGWYLRQCNVWAKPNGMPESVRDRSTVSHEYVFQLTKNNDYWYDSEAARTPPEPSSNTRIRDPKDRPKERRSEKQRGHGRRHVGFNDRWDAMTVEEQRENGANLRSVWWLAPANYREGHYAVMPDALAEICIVAGCPVGGTVLDPFGGAGTTGLVADRLQREAILIELNPEYAAMAERRIRGDAPLFAEVVNE